MTDIDLKRLPPLADGGAAVITGAGRAFSAGGDFNYLDELRNDITRVIADWEEKQRRRGQRSHYRE